ncbi:pirin family protein [Chromohalobacter sp. HP20-39]|uniref:pirin family protein n=1 Tax=Chromohalobacter sp. HP20-39 TaxID=3079306 RepID=UPI00294AAA13|nr:pirin family protein [Chromohalobacter sp. HP20-39]MDV6318355.1 pirin family protein [Chromohalobacter sp. HP20-39]
MSTTENRPRLYDSRECPVVDGHRLIQHLNARTADVGGIPVNRVIPQKGRRLIGAWCFLDHAGPATFSIGDQGMRVGPHPHTGLQTFTWMLAGEVMHRDSLGNTQRIRPGQLNLMTAGRGIAHTEESIPESGQLHAAQLWIALPHAERHTPPRFDHYPALPRWSEQGADATLLVGEFQDHKAPTLTFSSLLGLDLVSTDTLRLHLPARPDFEYGVLVLEGSLTIERDHFTANEMAYLGSGLDEITLALESGTRVLLLGGEPLHEDIFIWWNFVGHSKAEIAEAQKEWEFGSDRFGDVPEFDGERIMPPPIPWKIASN